MRMNIDYKILGARIKAERNKKGYTQDKLAEKLDVTVGYVSQIERGITKINLEQLAKISAILECDICVFLTGTVVQSRDYMSVELYEYVSRLSECDKRRLTAIAKVLFDNSI